MKRAILTQTTTAFADQALLSAANFAVSVLLIRFLAQADYGTFVLANAILFLAIGVQNALITTPMTVLAPRETDESRLQFVAALWRSQYVIWIPLAGIAAIGAMLDWLPVDALVAGATLIAILCIFLREFMRRVFFLYDDAPRVLLIDSISVVVALGFIGLFVLASDRPVALVLLGLGLAGGFSGIIGARLFKARFGWQGRVSLDSLRQVWRHGRWALLGVAVTWLHAQGFLYLLDGLRGREDVATISAGQKLLMPIAVLMTSMVSLLKPRGASWLASGRQGHLWRQLFAATLLASAFAGGYSVLLAANGDLVADVLYDKYFPEFPLLLLLWGGVMWLQLLRSMLAMAFQIYERFDTLFYIGAVAVAVSLTTAFFAIGAWGGIGSLAGLAAGELIYLVCMGALARTLRAPGAVPGAA